MISICGLVVHVCAKKKNCNLMNLVSEMLQLQWWTSFKKMKSTIVLTLSAHFRKVSVIKQVVATVCTYSMFII